MRVFISYSSKDKIFVKRLHESLILAGLDTFFDDKDIKVGDNIPQSIEKGIHEATSLIYVLSSNSLKSAWAQEELSMAKVKARAEMGFRILPVLIETLQLPMGLAHIRYADFTGWEHSERFFKGVDELLDGIGAERRVSELGSVSFAIRNYGLLLTLGVNASRVAEFIGGSRWGFRVGQPYDEANPTIYSVRSMGRGASDEFDDLGLSMQLDDLTEALKEVAPNQFANLRSELQLLSEGLKSLSFADNIDQLHEIEKNLENLATTINLLLREGLMQMMASINLETSQLSSSERKAA